MPRKLPTTADYMVIAISPALIMLLIGSLIFFLLTAFYDGQFEARLRYIAALFVFAAVLVGRISIEEGAERASVLAIPLAIATWVTLSHFTDAGSFVIAGIITLTWWSAHKLTWDCTLIDETEDDPGGGLLQAAGIEAEAADMTAPSEAPAGGEPTSPEPDQITGPLAWARRLFGRPTPSRKPGVWVVYFAIATLPLFGIGQMAISANNIAARRSAFQCLLVYVAAALGLMGTTSFLSIRRYLRQRRLEMPGEMALGWAVTAGSMIVAILLVASLLPRPRPAYSLTQLLESEEVARANRAHLIRDGATQKRDNAQTAGGQEAAETDNGETSKNESSRPRDADQPHSQRAEDGGQNEAGQGGNDGQRSKSPGDEETAGQKSGGQKSGGQTSGGEKSDSSRSEAQQRSEQQAQSAQESNRDSSRSVQNRIRQSVQSVTRSFSGGLASTLRWIYRIVIAAIVVYFVVRHARTIIRALREFFRDLLSLFGRQKPATPAGDSETPAEPTAAPRPFASFKNPFRGRSHLADGNLVRYMFRAVEAWACDAGQPRTEDETPYEFARRIGAAFPTLRGGTNYLLQLYDMLAYRGGIPAVDREKLQRLWNQLDNASVPRHTHSAAGS